MSSTALCCLPVLGPSDAGGAHTTLNQFAVGLLVLGLSVVGHAHTTCVCEHGDEHLGAKNCGEGELLRLVDFIC